MVNTGVPIMFRSGGELPSPSYNWYDYQAGVGYITFYLNRNYSGAAANDYSLVLTTISSAHSSPWIDTGFASSPQTYTFDVLFNYWATVSGVFFGEYTMSLDAGTGYNKIEVFHVSAAAVETSLGSGTAASWAGPKITRECIKISLTTKTFTPGETLRIKVTQYQANAGTNRTYCDPASRIPSLTETSTNATLGSDFKVHIPFKVDK